MQEERKERERERIERERSRASRLDARETRHLNLDLDSSRPQTTTPNTKQTKTAKLPPPPSFLPGQPWFDSDGNTIQAHGGSALRTPDGTYWWYGEDKSGASYETGGHWRVDTVGVAAYWSRDLVSWHRSPKLALAAVNEIPDLHPKTSILERPKVVYNAKTKK